MARTINRLTPGSIKTLPAGLHPDGGGLYLRIDASGSKRWVYLFQWRGRRKEMGLGSFVAVPLAAARKAAAAARQLVAEGHNRIEERRAARTSGMTFGEFADQYVTDQQPPWKSAKHISQWRYSVEQDAKSLRPIPIADITTEDVVRVLNPIWLTKPETAKRRQGRIERILDAAKARNLRAGENPAAWKGHLQLMLPKPKKLTRGHLAAMEVTRLPEFMAKIRGLPGSAARALEFTILTAGRTNEVLGAKWSEIDLEAAVWTVPGLRMKTGKEHRVPLSSDALGVRHKVRSETELLTGGCVAGDDFIFVRRPSNCPLSNMAMTMLMRRQKLDDLTVHGFRSTFRDWLDEHTSFAEELGEICLSHQVGSSVSRAYRRGDALERRREVMKQWAAVSSGRQRLSSRFAA